MENPKGLSPRENQQDEGPMENPEGLSPSENHQAPRPVVNPQDEGPTKISPGSSFRSLIESINTKIHPAILHAITLLIPVNIYVIGDWLGAGIQWPLLR